MFKIDSYTSGLVQYVRKNREKKGVLIAVNHSFDKNRIVIGYSLCNTKHDKFNRNAAIEIAYGRALRWDKSLKYSFLNVPHSIREDFVLFVLRAKKYFKDKSLPEWIVNELNVSNGIRFIKRKSYSFEEIPMYSSGDTICCV